MMSVRDEDSRHVGWLNEPVPPERCAWTLPKHTPLPLTFPEEGDLMEECVKTTTLTRDWFFSRQVTRGSVLLTEVECWVTNKADAIFLKAQGSIVDGPDPIELIVAEWYRDVANNQRRA